MLVTVTQEKETAKAMLNAMDRDMSPAEPRNEPSRPGAVYETAPGLLSNPA